MEFRALDFERRPRGLESGNLAVPRKIILAFLVSLYVRKMYHLLREYVEEDQKSVNIFAR